MLLFAVRLKIISKQKIIMKQLSKIFGCFSLLSMLLLVTSCADDSFLEKYEDTAVNVGTETVYRTEAFSKACGVNGTTESFEIITVKDNGAGTGTITWTKDKVYQLDGLVFVNEGQTLTIEAGTIVKGISGQGESASALVVARGAKIMAEGTATEPIIFTSAADGIFRNANGICSDTDGTPILSTIPGGSRGLWGGILILGKAPNNNLSSRGVNIIEGIPSSESRGIYGSVTPDPMDNSGILKYVSIRHGGTDIGEGNEINGLTLGSVGAGTTIEYVEVFGNNDDGFEWFGGTVNTKHLVSAWNKDDAMDYDEGWNGKNQFWLIYQEGAGTGDRGGEHDGGSGTDEESQPYATPVICNATYIGRGIDAGKRALTFRDNAGGKYYNSVFMNYGKGVDIERLESKDDSYDRLLAGDLVFSNNILYNIGGNEFVYAVDGDASVQANLDAYFIDNENIIATDNPLDEGFRPLNEAATPGVAPNDNFYRNVSYKGAANPTGELWIAGWTRLSLELGLE